MKGKNHKEKFCFPVLSTERCSCKLACNYSSCWGIKNLQEFDEGAGLTLAGDLLFNIQVKWQIQ